MNSELLRYVDVNLNPFLKAKKRVVELVNKYENKEYDSYVSYLKDVKKIVDELHNDTDKINFCYKELGYTPNSYEFNVMFNSAQYDIENVASKLDVYNKAILCSSANDNLEINRISNNAMYLNKKLSSLKKVVDGYEQCGMSVFEEDFITNNDKSIAGNESGSGVLTLKTVNNKSYNKLSKVNILNDSTGFIGDTHQMSIIEGVKTFKGVQNLRMNLSSTLDVMNNDWIEYEIFKIDNETYNECLGFGFEYKEGVKWITDNGCLKLNLEININSTAVFNTITITPPNQGINEYVSPIIKKIIAHNNDEYTVIDVNRVFNEKVVVTTNGILADKIEIHFEQHNAYPTKVGHIRYTKINPNYKFYQNNRNDLNRVNIKEQSLTSLGMKYNPETKEIEQPSSSLEIQYDETVVKNKIFNHINYNPNLKRSVECIDADRYMVAIQHINIAKKEYEVSTEYIKTFNLNKKNIRSITLEASEFIPDEFRSYNEKWISYHISFDSNSANWYEIYPLTRVHEGCCTLLINGITDFQTRSTSEMNIDTILDINQFRLKITLRRPSGLPLLSPVINNYKLLVEDADSDY